MIKLCKAKRHKNKSYPVLIALGFIVILSPFLVYLYNMKNKQTNELAVCGMKAVKELAAIHPEKISRLFFAQDRAPEFGKVCAALAKDHKLYRTVDDEDLEKLCKSNHHQGVVAMIEEPVIAPVSMALLEDWQATKKAFIVLDRVGNSNNLGAITRCAAFFGIDTIVLSGHEDQAEMSTSAYRVAEGGMEYMTFYRADNLALFMRSAKKYVVFAGADHRGKTVVGDLVKTVDRDRAYAVVLGNEEEGLDSEVRKACEVLIRIAGSGSIESLNVSQAGTLFISELAKIKNA